MRQVRAKLKKALKFHVRSFTALRSMDCTLSCRRKRGLWGTSFMLIVFGDLVGLPLLPPYYSMRRPLCDPPIRVWKRSILREKDLTDLASVDL